MIGADLSVWQGVIDWVKMKSKVDFVFIKASEANFVDSRFVLNWPNAKGAGLKRGAYHFYRAATDPGVQVRTFIEAMRGDYGELPPVVDVEDTNAPAPWTAKQVADLKWFIDVLHRFTGVKPIIYTGAWYWNPYMPLATWASNYDLWVANYVNSPAGKPYLPTAWSTYRYWQWTSSGSGALYGVASADIDLDIEAGAEPPPASTHPVPTFTISRSDMLAGQAALLVWEAPGASGIYLDGAGVTGPSNSKLVKPTVTTTYTLRVTFDGETDVTLPVSVRVTQPPAPPVTSTHYLGVNVIDNARGAQEVAAMGCKAFLVMGHPDVCEQIKRDHPDAVVVSREYIADWKLSGQQIADRIGGSDNGVIYELYNEADSWPYGDADQIRNRIDNEIQAAMILRARGAKVALGCYSTGTPNYNDPAIVEQMKRYALLYNTDAGCFFSMHNYSPSMVHIDNDADLIWYETRYRFLFDKCGFNPTQRKIIMTETGLDIGGVGGFGGANATAQQFSHWCTRYMQIMANTPVIASMIFAFTQGTNARWEGYNYSGWTSELKQAAGW